MAQPDIANTTPVDVGTRGHGRGQLRPVSDEIRRTLRLAFPLALTQVGQVAMFTVDLMLIGRLGDTYLAAAALAHTVLFTAFIFGMGVTSAVAPLTAQAVGAGDVTMTRRSLRVGLHASVLIALPIIALQIYCEPLLLLFKQPAEVAALAVMYLSTLAWSVLPAWIFMALRGYMSALDVPNPGLWIMLAGVPLNAALAYVLVFGAPGIPALGLIGAGIATTAVNILMCLAAIIVVMRHQTLSAAHPFERLWRPDWAQFAVLFAIGLPIAVTMTFEHGLFTAATLMAGALGATALASHQIALQVATLVFMLPMGFGLAASVRVGERVGARDWVGARRAGLVALILGLGVTVTTTTLTVVFADALPGAFLGAKTADNADTWNLGAILLIYAAAFFIVDGMQTILAGALRGYSDTKTPMLFAALSFWGIGFPVCYLLTFYAGLGARGIWLGLLSGLASYAALLLWRFLAKPLTSAAVSQSSSTVTAHV